MKLFIITGLLLFTICVKAQVIDKNEIFSNAHGLTQGTSSYFEVEGYEIFTQRYDNLFFDNTGIKKAKKNYKINSDDIGLVDSTIKIKHLYFVTNYKISDSLSQKSIFYFIPIENNKIEVIGFSRTIERDIDIERVFVKSIFENTLPEYVYSQPNTDSINFAGRFIYLGGACRWMGPHNVQCPDFGQLSWAEHRSIKNAKENANINYLITANRKMGDVLEKDSISVIFEGIDTKALRVIYKIKIPQLIMGGSNILIIYYVAEEVRGKNIACVMSQYTDNIKTKGLVPLLGEVMELK